MTPTIPAPRQFITEHRRTGTISSLSSGGPSSSHPLRIGTRTAITITIRIPSYRRTGVLNSGDRRQSSSIIRTGIRTSTPITTAKRETIRSRRTRIRRRRHSRQSSTRRPSVMTSRLTERIHRPATIRKRRRSRRTRNRPLNPRPGNLRLHRRNRHHRGLPHILPLPILPAVPMLLRHPRRAIPRPLAVPILLLLSRRPSPHTVHHHTQPRRHKQNHRQQPTPPPRPTRTQPPPTPPPTQTNANPLQTIVKKEGSTQTEIAQDTAHPTSTGPPSPKTPIISLQTEPPEKPRPAYHPAQRNVKSKPKISTTGNGRPHPKPPRPLSTLGSRRLRLWWRR